MKKTLSALLLLGACMSMAIPQASAQDKPAAPKKAVKKTAKKAPAKKKEAVAVKETPSVDDDIKEPDTAGANSVDFQCELGNKLTVYENNADEKHIALRWNKRVHRLRRVDTSTGANRFENRHYGLIWIGIPAKGMLLDSKKGQQLANECKNAEQMKPKVVDTALATPALIAPSAPETTPEVPAK
ncbi:MAG: hypothetical protein V4632_19280 [Pseudomonadota bacterium]